MNPGIENEKKVIDITIKLVLVLALLACCVAIIVPFAVPILWGAILAITLYPLSNKVSGLIGGRTAIASAIITGILLILFIIPAIWLLYSIGIEARELWNNLSSNTLTLTLPDEKIRNLPVIGNALFSSWDHLRNNLEETVMNNRERLMALVNKLASSLLSLTTLVFVFIFSVVLSGIFMAYAGKSQDSAVRLATKLLGAKGEELIEVVVQTTRNVAKGIIGVAVIQAFLMGIVLAIADVPFAGLWALVVLFLVIVQLPSALVGIPVMVYLFTVKDLPSAIIYAVLLILVSFTDNILKPLLMGKGAPVPMMVIFMGAIGGFIMMGFIGLFTGAMLLSIGYKLGGMWLES